MPPVQPNASVVATGLGIRYIGKNTSEYSHCYAYSGPYEAKADPQTVLELTTGSGFIVGEFQLNAAVSITNPSAGVRTLAIIYFNGETIAILQATSTTSSAPHTLTPTTIQPVVIPPFTKVEVKVDSHDNESAQFSTVTLTGRVYGAE